ncbi:MAG TPA: hypothetical protein VFS88_06320 [Micavibrio sp.]|nr:hypothetical protein [Micavibrio sp.]
MDLNLKNLDGAFKKLLDPKSSGDLNVFLEKLPQNAGNTVLIAAGIAWAMAGALGLYASIQARQLTELRAELKKAEALTPIVPKISDVAVPKADLQKFVEQAKETYKGLNFAISGSNIVITGPQTSYFARFREAISHVQNGGAQWRVSMNKLCVGRECGNKDKLGVSLKINKVSVENPAQSAPAKK